MRRVSTIVLFVSAVVLAGCDMLGIESPEKLAAVKEAEGRAIGGACRHAGRAIEDCYALNRRADKAAMFAGWREMNDYMRENKIDPVAPQLAANTLPAKPAAEAAPLTATTPALEEGKRSAKPAPSRAKEAKADSKPHES
jgi:hypothetical protein